MERHRTLDSSMSSLYSGSNISNATPSTRQQDTFNYPTLSSSASPTPSAALMASGLNTLNTTLSDTPGTSGGQGNAFGGASLHTTNISNSNANNNASLSYSNVNSSSNANPGLRATTIGTVVVRCGPIQLVIALLQSPEKLFIKVVELEPKITTLASNLEEAIQMQRDHDETLRNIDNLPGPMDEFVQKADKLLASKRISSELVNAMADTLNIIWHDILNLLHDRQNILHLCSQFHDKMTQCLKSMGQLEEACVSCQMPIEVAAIQEYLGKFKQLRIEMLTGVMAALKEGNELLSQLQELEKMETLDTRPEHIKRDAARSVYQVQMWLEALHDRRNDLERAWQTRKTQLEQCLALALLGRELHELTLALQQQRSETNTLFSLGECEHTANNALHNYRDWKAQALNLRDKALKITRAKEKLQQSGTFSGDEACAKAYSVLSECTEHLDLVDQREHWLMQSRDFFGKAEHCLAILEKIEVELSNVKHPPNSAESFALYSKISRDINHLTEEPLRLGYSILDEVGRTQPETQGVKRVLDEIENRKIYIEGICSASNEDHRRVQQVLEEFLQQYQDLLEWLKSSGQLYLQQHVAMGTSLKESKLFLLQHHELMQDLEIKGELINLLLESIKAHLESLSPQQRYDVDSKAEALHKHWIELKDLVLRRVDCVSVLIEFFEKAQELNNKMEELKLQLAQCPDEKRLDLLKDSWIEIRSDYGELKNRGKRFITLKIVDPYLETKSSVDAIEEVLNDFSKRQIDVTTRLESWSTHITEKREIEIILERIMTENEETVVKTTKVDTQLYPVFTTPSIDANYLRNATKEKLSLVMKDIEQAQDEIQQRIQTTKNLHSKDVEQEEKIGQVISNLNMLKSKLDGIKYDYKTLLESLLSFLSNIIDLRNEIDVYFAKQQIAPTPTPAVGNIIERLLIEHERFRDACMDKFRSLITQSELLIDRVRVLEPPGAKEIDTDRILKLLENLRIHFESGLASRMSSLDKFEKLEQFRSELCDIHRSLDSVVKQLNDINGQSVDSLATAKTTSLAFEYFERTIELLEKRIEKFSETTTQQLLVSNPESEEFVKQELCKLNEKWQDFKEQVRAKRNVLNQATVFFEMVEKIEAEYREITYFYNSVSSKITFLRDPVEAANLVNDIEKYVSGREGPLREKLDNASRSSHDMNKVSQLYNDVMAIFQSFVKLKSDINVVEERLKNEQRQREQRELEEKEKAERERALREAEARERAAREEEARLQAIRDQTARELAAREAALREEEERLKKIREQTAREEEERLRKMKEQALREQAAREEMAREEEERLKKLREQAAFEEEERLRKMREMAAREQAAREQAAREEEDRLRKIREQAAREEEERLRKIREQAAREQAAREEAAREDEARLKAIREEEARLLAQREQAQREQEARIQAVREQVIREEEARLRKIREEEAKFFAQREKIQREDEARILAAKEQAAREDQERLQALREEKAQLQSLREQQKKDEEARLQALREQTLKENELRLKIVRDQVDHHRTITENIHKDIRVNEVFTELKYASPRFLRPLNDAITREGERFTFECEVTGMPEPSIEWFKDGISIQSNPDYKTSYDKGICRLMIEETFAADSARFTCRASNLVGVNDSSATLSVRENAAEIQMVPPRFVRILESGSATEGASYQFSCSVIGNPLPTVSWFKNDKCIDDSQDYVISFNNGDATLRFEEVFLEDDAIYTCSAKNPAGTEHCSARLLVEPLEPTEMPHFKIPLSNAMARVGQKVKLEALIGGIPRPDIYWLHNGKPYHPRESKYEYGRVTLIIPQAYPNDAGVYVLTAKNLAGEAYSSCNVIVKGRLPNETSDSELASDMEPIKPTVQLPLKDVSIFEGKPVRLDCVIVGQPEPEVIWYHNDRPVKESPEVQLLFQGDRCSLIIQEVYQEDAGSYKVVALNSAGEASSQCELLVTPLNIAEPAVRAQNEQQLGGNEKQKPKFERLLSDVLVDEGETVELSVVCVGDQPLTAKWFMSNKELQTTDRIQMVCEPQEGVFKLLIHQVNADDRGVYTVKVTNEFGEAKCFSHLITKSVNVPESQQPPSVDVVEKHTCPEFVEYFSDINTSEGSLVKFECIVKGKPTPKVHWYFNDEPVHGHNFLVSTSGDRQVLIIQKASPETVGKISCIAENEVGKASCMAFLSLNDANGLPATPSTSQTQSMTQEHNTESSRVTIKKQTYTTTSTSQVNSFEGNMPQTEIHHSSAHIDQSMKQFGNQKPEILESRTYQEIHKGKDMSTPSVQQKSFSLIQSASNQGSTSSINQISSLTNIPSVPNSPTRLRKEIAPRFTAPLTGKIVDQGADVSMEAIYDGFPSPEIKVEKNGEPLFTSERTKIVNKCNKVTIDLKQVGISDAGRYAVTASNPMGQSTSTADLIVKKTIFPPVFGRRLQAQCVKRGEKIIMEVEVTGLPEPTVTWMKDDKPLTAAGISEHRLLSQGNSYKLIIEKCQTSDSGKYMVVATNAGGEAKSIADCAILEPSPERLQEVVKTIIYETPKDITSDSLEKEPMSFEKRHQETTNTESSLHGISESKIITEHRCTTEATMRLEHKTSPLDLPELSPRPKTPVASTNDTTNTTNTTDTTTNTDTTTMSSSLMQTLNTSSLQIKTPESLTPSHPEQAPADTVDSYCPPPPSKTVSFDIANIKAIPPEVPPKPLKPQYHQYPTAPEQTIKSTLHLPEQSETLNDTKSTASSFEYFKQMESSSASEPAPIKPVPAQAKKPEPLTLPSLKEELKSLNLEPGTPPEICFVPKEETTAKPSKPFLINEKIKKIEEYQQQLRREPPQGGVQIFPPLVSETTTAQDSVCSKQVQVEYKQPIIRPAASLQSPAQQNHRSPSPKPSAEGIAMSRLWTPTQNTTGYESCSDMEQTHFTPKLLAPTQELSAPLLVKQVNNNFSPKPSTTPKPKTMDDIKLEPGTPPEICFAATEPEGPTKVLPMSVPTLTPPIPTTKKQPDFLRPSATSTYKPPPPTMPAKLGRGDTFESDYESDRLKCSGSESDEASMWKHKTFESTHQYQPLKTSGYAADTEDIAQFTKTQTMNESVKEFKEMKSTFYSSKETSSTQPQQPQQPQQPVPPPKPGKQPQFPSFASPKPTSFAAPSSGFKPVLLERQPPAQLCFPNQNGFKDTQESFSSQKEYKHEEKDYKSMMSMSSNISYNMSSKTSTTAAPLTGPKFQSTPFKPQAAQVQVPPSPIPMQRKTPAEFSDYSSEIDERFRSVSRQYESDSDIKGYRVVFPPTPTPRATSITNGHKSPVVVVTPSPMEFEPNPPSVSSFPLRSKFEPIKKEFSHQIKTETSQQQQKQFHKHQQYQKMQQEQPQPVYKPKPVAAKFLAAAQKHQQPPEPEPSKPTMYYNAIAGAPLHMAKMATETKNVMQMKESSETCERVVNMQQTKRVIHFDNQKHEDYSSHDYKSSAKMQPETPLEPFPYSPSPNRMTPARPVPPLTATPTKFIPREFRESDYESEVENARIRPLWTPSGEVASGPLGYRHVEPPQPKRSCSVPRSLGARVLSPMEFDRGPEMPSKIQIDLDSLKRERRSSTSNVPIQTQTLGRHSNVRSTSAQTKENYSTLYENERQSFARDDMNLKVGSPPKYGYIQAQADDQGKRMGSTFLQKSHQFIKDIQKDFQKSSTKSSSSETKTMTSSKMYQQSSNMEPQAYGMRPGFKRAPSEGDNRPQAYRDDSRVSQYGTKCVDPNTGLIYFKYDFGYEFGILFPGEGHKFVSTKWNKSNGTLPAAGSLGGQPNGLEGRKSPYPLNIPPGSDLVIPVQHERSAMGPARPQFGGSSLKPKRPVTICQTNNFNGYYSDVEMRGRSPASMPNGVRNLQKRFSLPNATNIDINIDQLHSKDTALLPPYNRAAELPASVPVNAHLNRDDQPYKSPMFITPLKDIAVSEGGTARFECIVQAHPQATISWTRNEVELPSNSKFLIEYRNGVCRLTIPKAYPGDAAGYACVAANPLGVATTSGQLSVTPKHRGHHY